MAVERNFDNVQFGEFRRNFDGPFNAVHDELSDAYYNGTPFRSYGVLTKEQFDKLHGLIWHLYRVRFHEVNMAQPAENRIPEDAYNNIYDYSNPKRVVLVGRRHQEAQAVVDALAAEGYTLPDL